MTLNDVKAALRVTVNNYDDELTILMKAAQQDLGIAGVVIPQAMDPIVQRAVITYCKVHFSALSDGEYSRLKASYDEQKAQLMTATGYTNWGAADDA